MKDFDTNIDQLRRELIDKTNENRSLITEIRGLEQGLKEIDQQLKQKRFQRTGDQSSSSPYVIQCPSLDKMLQVFCKTVDFLKTKFFSIQVLETQSLAGRYDGAMMLKSENDKLLGRLAELRDELYNARHEKTRTDVNLKLAVERVRRSRKTKFLFYFPSLI